MSRELRKKILSGLFFFVVLGLTIKYVFGDKNLYHVVDYLSGADYRFVIPAVIAVVLFILGDSVVVWYLLYKLGTKPRFGRCCLYSFIGFFYCAITPSASGGQPMQVMAMRHDGIPATVSTVVLAIVTILYKLVLVLLGLGVLIFRPASVMVYLGEVESLMYLGLALNVVCISVLLLAVFHPGIARAAAKLGCAFARRFLRLKDPQKLMDRVDRSLADYQGAADCFKANPRLIFRMFLITVVQRFCLFSVVWFTYLAFGMQGESALVMMVLYGMISVAVDMLPLPGGMGISENLFLAIFEPIFGKALVLPCMIVCRGISYYTQLLISAVMTGISRFLFRKKN